MPSRRRLASTARIRWYRDEPTSLGPGPDAEGPLGGDEHLVAAALDRLAEDLLGQPARVDVGRVEHRQPGVEADVDEPRGLGDVARAPGLEELAAAAERAGAEAQDGHPESRSAEYSIFHGRVLLRSNCPVGSQSGRADGAVQERDSRCNPPGPDA